MPEPDPLSIVPLVMVHAYDAPAPTQDRRPTGGAAPRPSPTPTSCWAGSIHGFSPRCSAPGATRRVHITVVPANGGTIEGTPLHHLPAPEPEDARGRALDALRSRLPPGIGRDIIALETEDHYLRVHAAGGSALILMRMADAVAMLDPRLGAQVHRRWWVAAAAVTLAYAATDEPHQSFIEGRNGSPVDVAIDSGSAKNAR